MASFALVADDGGATAHLLHEHLRLAWPATVSDLTAWLVTRSGSAPPDVLKPIIDGLQDGLEPVYVEGGQAPLRAHVGAVAAMDGAPEPPLRETESILLGAELTPAALVAAGPALLLPPHDAYLLGSRALRVPDRAIARTVWRPVGGLGVLVLAGEVAGVWRARHSVRCRGWW